MRIAALFLGLIAGLFVLLVPSALRIDLISPFLDFWANSTSERLLGTIGWYALAGAAMLGGLLATVTPGFAALLLLGAAVGWLGIGISVPQLFTYHLLAPAGAAAVAAAVAFLAGELQIRRRRVARRSRRLAVEAAPANDEIEREAAYRADPLLMPRQDLPTPKRGIPLTLSDVTVTSRPAAEPPRWQDLDAPPGPRGRDPDIWAEARREPAPPAVDAPRPRREPEPVIEARRAETWAEPELEPEPEPRPRRAPPTRRERRGSGLIAAMAAVAAVLVLGLVLGAGAYLFYRDGNLAALPSASPSAPSAVAKEAATEPTPKPAVPAAAAASATEPAKVGLPASPPATPAATSGAAAPAAVVADPSSVPLRVAAAPAPELYDDPSSYCRAVGTIDYVDYRYAGPAFTEAMTRTLLIPLGSARDRVHWRCFNGTVLACTSYLGPICDMAPTVLEMREFCERNPNVDQLMAPSGTWSCADGQPQLPTDARWPVDERGFVPRAWVTVPDTEAAPAG